LIQQVTICRNHNLLKGDGSREDGGLLIDLDRNG